MFDMGANSDLGQPFRSRQKRWGLGWEESRLSRYDIHAERALLPSKTVIVRVKIWAIGFAMFI